MTNHKKQSEEKDQTLQPEYILLDVDNVTYKTLSNKMHDNRKEYQPNNPSLLKSFMPGSIPEVFVKEGDLVHQGDNLLLLEAMKMKNLIIAPFDGMVKKINVKTGDRVAKNFVLLEMVEQDVPQIP